MLVDWIHNGKQVVAPVRIDSLSKQNNIRIDANSVTTVFGKDNVITKLLDTAIKKEEAGEVAIYYWDKEKASSLMSGAGLQLPGGRTSSGFIHNINDPDSPVKPVIADQTDTHVGVSNMGNTLGALLSAVWCQGKGGDLRSKYYLTLTPFPW